MKRIKDLTSFKNTLPYASEIFGIYQPLLGWKSKRIRERILKGFDADKTILLANIYSRYDGQYEAELDNGEIHRIEVGELSNQNKEFGVSILREVSKLLPTENEVTDLIWDEIITKDFLENTLNTTVIEEIRQWISRIDLPEDSQRNNIAKLRAGILKKRLDSESVVAGALLDLTINKLYKVLEEIFYVSKSRYTSASLIEAGKYKDPFEYMDPKKDLDRVGLSPLGIVHLFRQYFYEFDTFLGRPVGHVWLSPGSEVELIEISTRKTLTEKFLERRTENLFKLESTVTEQDEISDAIKEENMNNIKFGSNTSAEENWIVGSSNQNASFDMNTTQKSAREQSHKYMRQQSEKLSTEIRKNYKSTFKTVTEYTDTSTKRYLLRNSTKELINYELRRKMRQVQVQVQDIGTYLCWQTYVDQPGLALGISNLVHIAKSPDTDQLSHPEEIVPPKQFTEKVNIQIPFVPTGSNPADQKDISYTHGKETHVDDACDKTEYIECDFPQKVICKKANYFLDDVKPQPKASEVKATIKEFKKDKNSNEATFTIHLDYVHFNNQNFVNLEVELYWQPTDQYTKEIEAENKKRLEKYTAQAEAIYKKAYIDAARQRIKLASNIQSRRYEDLREEERIVVYRKLIQELLVPKSKVPQPDYRTRHIISELINSIFDVDKMLYFVAPEWWMPKNHYHQSLGIMQPTGKIGEDGKPVMKSTNTITDENLVGWSGINGIREDNYYITEESTPAKLGSSLGWLLQLDGDNMRNAFLNAPWVKAVVPIRPGKEKAALNWLKQIEGMNGITDADMYTGKEPELQGKSMNEVLDILAEKVRNKHMEAIKTSKIPDPDNPNNDDVVTATPVDKVYEHGFYPLQGGFKSSVGKDFEIFDEWVEILPTDQVVVVEVKYDSKTGRQT